MSLIELNPSSVNSKPLRRARKGSSFASGLSKIGGSSEFYPGRFEHNFTVLARLADEKGIGLLRVGQVHMDRGKKGSVQACALAQAAYDYFGAECGARVSGNGKPHLGISDQIAGLRYIVPLMLLPGEFCPPEYDAGTAKPGAVIISKVRVTKPYRMRTQSRAPSNTPEGRRARGNHSKAHLDTIRPKRGQKRKWKV